MTLTFSCPGCGKRHRAPLEWNGKMVRCDECDTRFRVPSGNTSPLPPEIQGDPNQPAESPPSAPPRRGFEFSTADTSADAAPVTLDNTATSKSAKQPTAGASRSRVAIWLWVGTTVAAIGVTGLAGMLFLGRGNPQVARNTALQTSTGVSLEVHESPGSIIEPMAPASQEAVTDTDRDRAESVSSPPTTRPANELRIHAKLRGHLIHSLGSFKDMAVYCVAEADTPIGDSGSRLFLLRWGNRRRWEDPHNCYTVTFGRGDVELGRDKFSENGLLAAVACLVDVERSSHPRWFYLRFSPQPEVTITGLVGADNKQIATAKCPSLENMTELERKDLSELDGENLVELPILLNGSVVTEEHPGLADASPAWIGPSQGDKAKPSSNTTANDGAVNWQDNYSVFINEMQNILFEAPRHPPAEPTSSLVSYLYVAIGKDRASARPVWVLYHETELGPTYRAIDKEFGGHRVRWRGTITEVERDADDLKITVQFTDGKIARDGWDFPQVQTVTMPLSDANQFLTGKGRGVEFQAQIPNKPTVNADNMFSGIVLKYGVGEKMGEKSVSLELDEKRLVYSDELSHAGAMSTAAKTPASSSSDRASLKAGMIFESEDGKLEGILIHHPPPKVKNAESFSDSTAASGVALLILMGQLMPEWGIFEDKPEGKLLAIGEDISKGREGAVFRALTTGSFPKKYDFIEGAGYVVAPDVQVPNSGVIRLRRQE